MRVAAAGLAAGLLWCTNAAACGEGLGGGTRQLSDETMDLVFKTRPAVPIVGHHFVLDIALCPRGKAAAPATLRVDARMPEHRHGMNYQPSVTRVGPGRYRAQGLMFHMPGRWELVFELRWASGAVQRLTQTLTIE